MDDYPKHSDTRRLHLFAWVWRAWMRAGLLPLLLVEAVIIVVYLLATAYATDENLTTTRDLARDEIARIAAREVVVIDRELEGVADMTRLYAAQVLRYLEHPTAPQPSETERYRTSAIGSWYTVWDPTDTSGRCAVYFSGARPIDEAAKAKAWGLAGLDPLMTDILTASPLVSQVYFNSYDSMNRICPPFDVLKQYPVNMDIPTFNFYYLADATHNPARKAVWTDAYVDPAGQGWMASSIAPVYRGDFLEGVVGLDVTLERFARRVLDLGIPWGGYGVLISRDGTILAMPEAAENDFGMAELKQHHYAEAILRDTFKPDSYNVFKRADLAPLAAALQADSRTATVSFREPVLVAWETIPTTGWRLAVLVPERAVLAAINDLDSRLREVGYWMIAGVVGFYAVFVLMLFWRARALARTISEPLARMDAMAADIARGRYHQEPINHPVVEVQRTSNGLVIMGRELEVAAERVAAARRDTERQAGFLQAIIDTVPVPVFFTSDDGALAGANRAFSDLTARLYDSGHDALITSLVAESGRRSLPGAEPLVWQADPRDGREYLCRFESLPPVISSAHQGRSGVVGVLIDITAQRQAQALAERARDEAVEASRLKSEFLASVSHEIRTPMNGVIGVTELLAETGLDTEQRSYVRTIQESADALLVVINDILDFARIEAGRLDTVDESFDLLAIVEGVVEILSPRAHQKGLEVTSFVDPHLAETLVGDSGRIRQILLNLVGNAVKFTESGVVSVSARSIDAGDTWTLVRFDIEDTGPGVAESARHRLFQPFSQVDASNGRRYGGTGLGLSIAKRIVEVLGGEIGFENRFGGGARFWFTVPLKPERPAAPNPEHCSRTVVVCEPRRQVAENLLTYLRAWNFAAVEAPSVAAVLEMVATAGNDVGVVLLSSQLQASDRAAVLAGVGASRCVIVGRQRPADGEHSDVQTLAWPLRRRCLLAVVESILFSRGSERQPGEERNSRELVMRGEGLSVLVVEDHDVSRLVIEKRLRDMGLAVTACADAAAAVAAFSQTPFPLALVDVQLPVGDGVALTAHLRGIDATRGTQCHFIAVTASSMEGDRERLVASGFDDYLAKPFSADGLTETVARGLGISANIV